MVAGMLRLELYQALWRYRGFIQSSIRREFQTRYLGSALGAAWNVLNPLVQIIIWTVVFAELMRRAGYVVPGGTPHGNTLAHALSSEGLTAEEAEALTTYLQLLRHKQRQRNA